jgi:hypothetical protein
MKWSREVWEENHNMPTEDSNRDLKNYQWPADKLTAKEMAILYRLRKKSESRSTTCYAKAS